jgi:hypothetical protein
MLLNFSLAKCYIDDIIVFNLTIENRMHHLQEGFEKFKNHNDNFHPCKCWFFYLGGVFGLYDLSMWIGGSKGQNLAISYKFHN